MRSLSPVALLAVLSVSVAFLAGCNVLTEPSEFKVVKEQPRQQPAAPPIKVNDGAAPGGLVAADPHAGHDQAKGAEGNVRPANDAPKRPAQAQRPSAPSCGE